VAPQLGYQVCEVTLSGVLHSSELRERARLVLPCFHMLLEFFDLRFCLVLNLTTVLRATHKFEQIQNCLRRQAISQARLALPSAPFGYSPLFFIPLA